MKKFFILFILCFLFVGCAFDTNNSGSSYDNLTIKNWYNTSSSYLIYTKCFCKKISTLEYNVISIEEYCFYTDISLSTARNRIHNGYYDDWPSYVYVSTRTKDVVLNNTKEVFHFSGKTPCKRYDIRY